MLWEAQIRRYKQTGFRIKGRMMKNIRTFGLLSAVLLLFVSGFNLYAVNTNNIQTISPSSTYPGTNNMFVTFTLNKLPPPPPISFVPTSVLIGTNFGTSIARPSSNVVTAVFNIPSTETPGSKDVQITVTANYLGVKSNGFVVVSTQVVYVASSNISGPWTGVSWSGAFTNVQDAITAASGPIWIAQGTYRPAVSADRTASFCFKPGTSVYGGFAGTESTLEQRNWSAHPTVLSGDIGMAGVVTDNCYHVVTGTNGMLLDGFIISGGYANGRTYNSFGGGMINYNGASPTVRNCIFTGNYANEGGGIYSYNDCLLQISDSIFAANTAKRGGAMVNRDGSNCMVTNSVFNANSAVWRGGAIYIDYGASPMFFNCSFSSNSTAGHGGAVYVNDVASQIGNTSPAFTNCAFIANSAGYRGGAVANYNKVTPAIGSCGFTNNTAGTGGGAIANDYQTTATISGCSYSGNKGGSGVANVDTDATSVVN
jgi:predicted outer membrane repeat protein